MQTEHIAKIKGGRQDGAISNGYLFSLDHRGICTVYKMQDINSRVMTELTPCDEFLLDKSDIIIPHSNCVMFGNEYYSQTDKFPLLYTNIYNNYAKEENKMKGTCLVYRLQMENGRFNSALVQIIEVGFTEDEDMWKSPDKSGDVRPYGNFAIDTENSILYAYTMRDESNTTRYFAFDLPKAREGVIADVYGVPKVTLKASDVKDMFDCEYQHYIQGVSLRSGKIYSLEGFTDSLENPPALRIVDLENKKDECVRVYIDYKLNIEPEMIDFDNDKCYYTDHEGNVYRVNFGG